MARPKKIEQTKQCNESLESVIFKNLGEYRTKLVKSKLIDKDLEKLVHALLIEWAQGRVNL